jgi:hypothetical protein
LTFSLEGYLGRTIPEQVSIGGRLQREVKLTRAATITGRVVDANRQPAAGIEVQLLHDTYDALRRRFLGPLGSKGVRTDEKGEYRFSLLAPGDYYIRASYTAEPARRTIGALLATTNTSAATYYPGVTTADEALPLKISGLDLQAADFSIEPLSPCQISGRIVNPFAPTPVDRYSYFLVRRDARVRDGDGLVPDRDPDIDKFELRNIPSGSYDLYVGFRSGPALADPFLVGHAAVDVVDKDVTELTIDIESGIDITGAWKSEDPAAIKNLERGPVALRPVDGMPEILAPEVTLRDDGTVTASRVPRGRYVLSFVLRPTSYVATARFGGRDVIGQPIDIDENTANTLLFEFSRAGGILSGTVTDRVGKPSVGTPVVLVPPIDLQLDAFSYKTSITDAQGRFVIMAIRPGLYTAFAIMNASTSLTPYCGNPGM